MEKENPSLSSIKAKEGPHQVDLVGMYVLKKSQFN